MTKTIYQHLGQEQRYQIQAHSQAGKSKAWIAQDLGVARSTITRELSRNSLHSASKNTDLYKAKNAQNFADHRAYRRPPTKSTAPAVCRRLHYLLPRNWSPEQIACTCKERNIIMLSTESIYLWIYKLRDQGGTDYTKNLRHRHRKNRKRRLRKDRRLIIKDRVSISERPEVVNNQERVGDLETDLVKCTNGYLLTVTDRKTLFNFIVSIPDKEANTVQEALIKVLSPYKGKLFTITSDNGTEFVRHKEVAEALGIDWHFADPYCSQQRGCNENQNGLMRQYFPSCFDLSTAPENYVLWVQNKLNFRPRKKNNFIAPINLFFKLPGVALAA